MLTEKFAPHLTKGPHLKILSISIRMPEVIAVNLAWINSLYQHLRIAMINVSNVEHNTYDMDKADALQLSIRQIEEVMKSLNKVVSNPEKYSISI